MAEEQQFKRNVAYKLRIGEILGSKPVLSNDRLSFLDFDGKRVVRVNVAGSIVDKYDSEGEKKYSFLTLDDGSGQIKMKAFGDDAEKLKDITHGQTVIVIGSLRHFNNEVYISPEIVREQNPKYLLVRKMEVEGKRPAIARSTVQNFQAQEKGDISPVDVREKVLSMIKSSESNGGIETIAIVRGISQPQDVVNEEIKRLLEEGIIFEPLPGKVRWLG